jgi:hypothetical protein
VELACGCGRDDGAGEDVFAGFASLWSSALSAIALEKNQIIVYIPERSDEPSSLSFSTRTSGLRVIGFQVSSSTRDETKS